MFQKRQGLLKKMFGFSSYKLKHKVLFILVKTWTQISNAFWISQRYAFTATELEYTILELCDGEKATWLFLMQASR